MINIYNLPKKKIEKEKIKDSIHQKMLERCHKKIKLAANKCESYTYFVVPEYEFGIPMYNVVSCANFITEKLKENHFYVYYTYPNLIIISWSHIEHNTRKEIEYEKAKIGFALRRGTTLKNMPDNLKYKIKEFGGKKHKRKTRKHNRKTRKHKKNTRKHKKKCQK